MYVETRISNEPGLDLWDINLELWEKSQNSEI